MKQLGHHRKISYFFIFFVLAILITTKAAALPQGSEFAPIATKVAKFWGL